MFPVQLKQFHSLTLHYHSLFSHIGQEVHNSSLGYLCVKSIVLNLQVGPLNNTDQFFLTWHAHYRILLVLSEEFFFIKQTGALKCPWCYSTECMMNNKIGSLGWKIKSNILKTILLQSEGTLLNLFVSVLKKYLHQNCLML